LDDARPDLAGADQAPVEIGNGSTQQPWIVFELTNRDVAVEAKHTTHLSRGVVVIYVFGRSAETDRTDTRLRLDHLAHVGWC
jgi:hypothetical protein